MTCRDCIYYSGCSGILNDFGMRLNPAREVCDRFKDRARFVELPCKVEDIIFCIIHILGETEIVSSKVQRILFTEDDCRLIVQDNNYIGLSINDVGKTIFLTREEAEQAFRGEKNK